MVLDHKTKYFECKLAFTNLLKATMKGKISQTLIVIVIKFIIAMFCMIWIMNIIMRILMFLKGMCRLPDGKLMKKHFEKVDII